MAEAADDMARWIRSTKRRMGLSPKPAPAPAPKRRPPPPVNADGSGPRRRVWAKSGVKAAYQVPSGRWAAKVRYAGGLHHVGTFDTPAEAEAAAARKVAELSGGRDG